MKLGKTLARAGLVVTVFVLAGCATDGPPRASRTPTTAAVPTVPRVAEPPPGNPAVWPPDAPAIYAQSAIMIDAATGKTLYQKNADVRRPVASTQKLLTALIVAERDPLDGLVVIHPEDTRVEPTKLGLKAGEAYLRRDLLGAMIVKSANDAAAALGRAHSGSEAAFAQEMTRYAHGIGAYNSRFANAHGLPANQYSTARDMARIAFRAYRNPIIRRMAAQQHWTFQHANGRVSVLESTNKLLKRSPIYNGLKTGYTAASGRCLVTSATANGRHVILVQLGSKTQYIFDDADRLCQWALRPAWPF